jgi:hypothetical protein
MIIAVVLVLAALSIAWFISFDYETEEYCGESPVYRYKLGVYSCEYNAEAASDFTYWKKLEGFWSMLV